MSDHGTTERVSGFTKPEALAGIVEKNRFVAERAEDTRAEVVVFSDGRRLELETTLAKESDTRYFTVLDQLGIREVTYDRIHSAGYRPLLSSNDEPETLSPYRGERDLQAIFTYLADRRAGMWEDNPNDFEYLLEIELGDGLSVQILQRPGGVAC